MKLNKYRRWTREEDILLEELYDKLSLKELGKIFDRSPQKCCRRASRLGIKKSKEGISRQLSKAILRSYKNGSRSVKGKNNPNWSGGKMVSNGYVYLHLPDHPKCDSRGYVAEHTVVLEKKLKRYLTKEECVHHLNGIKNDNAPENLVLCASNSEHIRKFHTPQERGSHGRFVKETGGKE